MTPFSTSKNASKPVPKVLNALEKTLDADDYRKLLVWPWTLFLAIGGASIFTIFGNEQLSVIFVTVLASLAIIYLIGVSLGFYMLLRRLNADLIKVEDRSTYYAKALSDIQRSDPDLFSIESWDETVNINRVGDVIGVKDLVLVCGERGIPVVSSVLNSYNSPDREAGMPNKFKLTACWIDSDGHDGVAIHCTYKFSPNDQGGLKMLAFMHYSDTIEPKSTLRIRMRWEWSQHSFSLMQGNTEKFDLTLKRQCGSIHRRVILGSDCNVKSSMRYKTLNSATPEVIRTPNDDGTISFTLEAKNVPAGSVLGFELGCNPSH
jgi:hypothetical protein